jgi:sugar lactone lactonase YvrE
MIDSRLGLPLSRPLAAAGWQTAALTKASGLLSANGLRRGPDQRLYIAQAFGSQISALNLSDGTLDIVAGFEDGIVSPDDLAFDSKGNLFTTEVMNDRVSVRRLDGRVDILKVDTPAANGLTVHRDRIIVSEYRHGGRLLEIFDGDRKPRVIRDNLMYPNALAVGRDNYIYFPLAIPNGEIWRMPLDGVGEPERIATGLDVPTAVKFNSHDELFVTEAGTGRVSTIDLKSGSKRLFSQTLPGIDNIEFDYDGTLLLSNWSDGSIVAIRSDTLEQRVLVPGSMLGPFGIAARSDGALLVADGLTMALVQPTGEVSRPIVLVHAGAPPWMCGVALDADGSIIFSSPGGVLSRFRSREGATSMAKDLDLPTGVATSATGEHLVCETGAGQLVGVSSERNMRIIAKNLKRPMGVCVSRDGTIFVSEAAAGRVIAIDKNDGVSVVLDGLKEPHGVAVSEGELFVFDRVAGTLHCHEIASRMTQVIVSGLPSDALLEGRRKEAPGIKGGPLEGPLQRFNGVAAFPNGRICVACEADGSIWQVQRQRAAAFHS